jgi:hypothetical protein
MMNLVTIGLVLSILAAAGVWSPAPPSPPETTSDHVVQDGRRVVIVEYERGADGGLTQKRVLSSRPLNDGEDGAKVLEERLHDASKEGAVHGAVNRCKDRICDAGRRVEEGAKDGAEDVARSARETASDDMKRAENKAFDAAQQGRETLERAKDKASRPRRGGRRP